LRKTAARGRGKQRARNENGWQGTKEKMKVGALDGPNDVSNTRRLGSYRESIITRLITSTFNRREGIA